IQPSVGAV
ncbi:hypothetical protein LDE48_14355, partial [Mycobacterium tuberculosis]